MDTMMIVPIVIRLDENNYGTDGIIRKIIKKITKKAIK